MALLSGAMPASAGNVFSFSYDDGSADQYMWGTSKKENYDVAVFFNNPQFVGAEIVGLRVVVQNSDDVTDYSAWLSSELKLNGKLNDPDITSKAGERKDWTLEVMFDQPYKLTDKGVYVGYSCSVASVDEVEGCYPLAVAEGVNTNAFFLHTSRSFLKWDEYSESRGYLSSLEILIQGDFDENSVSVVKVDEVNIKAGADASTKVTVANTGVNTISSIGYEYSLNGSVVNSTQEFEPAIPAQYGLTSTFDLELPKIAEVGIYPMTFKVTTVNGQPNAESVAEYTTDYCALSRIPKHIALVEEYTGTWCTWCPRGYVGMELMNEKHPDFVGIAYHSGDPMEIAGTQPYPGLGYPSSTIERTLLCDPYFGISEDEFEFGMDPLWQEYCKTFTPFEITLEADFTDDSRTAVYVDAEVVAVKPINKGEYRVEFVLVEDGMTGTTAQWLQSNGYANGEGYRGMEGMDMFIDGTQRMMVPFNDVAIANTGNLGVEGSLPATLEADVEYDSRHVFELETLKNASGQPIIVDKNKLRAVAMVVLNDGSEFGKVMNVQKCELNSLSGCAVIEADNTDAEPEYYDLNGRRVSNLQPGFYIKRIGNTASKVLVK